MSLTIAVLETMGEILETVITSLVQINAIPIGPVDLYHYTGLETIQKILAFDDIRLTHAEYSNDQQELELAKSVIQQCLSSHTGTPAFIRDVTAAFSRQAPAIDAYIFCMSMGMPGVAPKPQDMLSQWRAYALDGRGGSISLQSSDFSRLVPFLTGFRINPIIYDRAVQDQLVNDIIDQGLALDAAGDPNAVDATVAALVFTTPLMKVVGFSEEREWRLIYMPPQEGSTPPLQFHPRRDFLAPFITLQDLWKVRSGAPRTGSRRAAPPTVLVAAKAIMVGPSGNLKLNVRAMQKVITQHRPSLGAPDQSDIPYRSLG